MIQHRREWNIKVLCLLVLLGTAYSSLLYYERALTGSDMADGIIAVLFGLYVCSHPAANVINMFFFRRGVQGQSSSKWSPVLWVALNMMTLLIGWMVIFFGTIRIVGRPE